MSDDPEYSRPEAPFNALPPMVVALALVLGGIEIVFQIGALGVVGGPEAVGWRLSALQEFSFIDDVFEQMQMLNIWPFEHVRRFFTYAFVHVSFTHCAMALVFILAMGKMVGEVFGNIAVLVIFALCTVAGALAYGLILDTARPLMGGYPAAYGFIGAYSFVLWVGYGRSGENRLAAFRLIAFLMGIQAVYALLFGGGQETVADLAGFAMGFVLSVLFVPGTMGRILTKLRQR